MKSTKDSKSEFICSFVTAVVKSLLIQPFDFIRIRLQTTSTKKINLLNSINGYKHNEGITVFLKGSVPTIMGSIFSSVFHLTCYQNLLYILKYRFFYEENINETQNLEIFKIRMNRSEECCETKNCENYDNYRHSLVKKLSLLAGLSGLFSGVLLSVLSTPFDNIRIRLQSMQNIKIDSHKAHSYKFRTPSECFKVVFSQKGLGGFYVAFPICMLRESLASFIYFFSFEYFKNSHKLKHSIQEISFPIMFLYGGFSGVLNWVFTLPVDCLKTNIISDTMNESKYFNGIRDCLNKIYKHHGLRGFFAGFYIILIRAFFVNGAVLSSYEICRNRLIEGRI